MRKEIGSIFPLSDAVLSKAESEDIPYKSDRLFYSLCREALYDIAKTVSGIPKKVLIPAYTCQTVITPFEEAGWQYEFFSIKKDLRINIRSLLEANEEFHPSLVVVHPYFGMDLCKEEVDTLISLKQTGVKIVLDLTQCIFTDKEYDFASFIVASYRKWMPIPDGGYLINKTDTLQFEQPDQENNEFSEKEKAAMYLRGQYFGNGQQRTKDISIRLSKEADNIAESNIIPHKMSQVAYNLMNDEDIENNTNRRFANYTYLSNRIVESQKVKKVCVNISEVTTAPLYFTIYVQNRQELQKLLAKEAIYAPVIWPVEDEQVLIDDDVRYIYNHLLAIPCDQRYNEHDMQRAVEIINNY